MVSTVWGAELTEFQALAATGALMQGSSFILASIFFPLFLNRIIWNTKLQSNSWLSSVIQYLRVSTSPMSLHQCPLLSTNVPQFPSHPPVCLYSRHIFFLFFPFKLWGFEILRFWYEYITHITLLPVNTRFSSRVTTSPSHSHRCKFFILTLFTTLWQASY